MLKGKKALVTGGSQGIGKSIALQLAAEGADVCIHYHTNEKEADEVMEAIRSCGVAGHKVQADFNEPETAISLAQQAWEELGRIDFLINNAGVSYKKHFLDATIKDVDHFTNINFKSTLFLTQAVSRKMVESNIPGSIYTITSINGIQPGVGLNIYGATKGALETLMKGVALELAPHNIKVNTVAVGAIKTSMTAAVSENEQTLKLVNDNIPLGRMGEADEVADVICSLLKSGSYMTGSTIVIDGGWMLKQGYVNPQPWTGR